MKTALLALTLVGALAGSSLTATPQEAQDDALVQELRDQRDALNAELIDLQTRLDVMNDVRAQSENQLNVVSSQFADSEALREMVQAEIAALRMQLDETAQQRDSKAAESNALQADLQAVIAAMEREIMDREMQLDQQRAQSEVDMVREQLEVERQMIEMQMVEMRAARNAERTNNQAPTAPATGAGSGITIILNGGDVHFHGGTDDVRVVQPAGSR